MPQHVEFSISDPHQPRPETRTIEADESTLDRWGATVDGAAEPCLVIDEHAVVVAMSASFEEMLGIADSPVNRPLVDGDAVLQLLDFGDGKALDQIEVARMPPLVALSGRLARGLIRIRCASGPCTFDAIAAPLNEDDRVVGSLTFFSAI